MDAFPSWGELLDQRPDHSKDERGIRDAIPDLDELLDQRAVARMLNVTEKFLEARRYRGGGIPFCKIGSLVRYRRGDVLGWIQAQRRTSTSDGGRVMS